MSHDEDGIVIIDKPANLSSAGVVSRVKRSFNARKAGHTGTLDPMATGILVCCLNDATRLARFFLGSGKTYEAMLHLGIETDTQDATGTVIATSAVAAVSGQRIESVLKQFTGEILQQPPAYSALKHKGVPLYKLARKGQPVLKPARKVTISQLQVTHVNLPEITFAVACSAGTYIRTLGAEIGAALGCGGHLTALRRTACGDFTLGDAVSLSDLEALDRNTGLAEHIINMPAALTMMPVHYADGTLADRIRHGIRLSFSEICPEGESHPAGYVKVVDEDGALAAVVRPDRSTEYYRYCCVFRN